MKQVICSLAATLFLAVNFGLINLAEAQDRYIVTGTALVQQPIRDATFNCGGDDEYLDLEQKGRSQADENAKNNCKEIGFSSANRMKDYKIETRCKNFGRLIQFHVSSIYECQ